MEPCRMSFWDGSRWTNDQPASLRPPRRRVRDWLATVPIIFLVPVLLSPFLAVNATGAELAVSGAPVRGGLLSVIGSGLPGRDWVQLTWDGSASGTSATRTSSNGTFIGS